MNMTDYIDLHVTHLDQKESWQPAYPTNNDIQMQSIATNKSNSEEGQD